MTRGRWILVAFGAAALVLILSPAVVYWWVSLDACGRTVMADGRFPSGMGWEISRSDCGQTVGTVWQVRVAATGSVPRIVFDARNAPRPVSVGADPNGLAITLERPTATGQSVVVVPLDYRFRPRQTLRFVDGVPQG